MRSKRVQHGTRRRDREPDPVTHCKPRFLPQALHATHDLARHPLGAQCVTHRGVEGHGESLALLHHQRRRGARGDRHPGCVECERSVAGHLYGDRATLLDDAKCRLTELLDHGLRRLHRRAKHLPQYREIRLPLELHPLGGGIGEVHGLHVQLRRDERGDHLVPSRVEPRRHTGQRAERLPHLDPGGLARRTAEGRQGASRSHPLLQRGIGRRRRLATEIREMHRAPRELHMQPVGDKGRERRQEATRHHEHLVQRREGRAIVRAAHIVEPPTRKSHVPVRDILGHKVHQQS